MDKESNIFIAGAETMVGAALERALPAQGFTAVASEVTAGVDLRDRGSVEKFLAAERPDRVFLVAGKSAGIMGNINAPAELMLDNLAVQCNVIDCAYRHGIGKLLYLASSCCYPRSCPQPMRPEHLLTGALEATNEPYAVAKISGLKLVEAYRKQHGARFISCIPANSFGPGDDFDFDNAHVVSALMRRMHEAKEAGAAAVEVWGSGKPRREFAYVDDLADACVFAMAHYEGEAPLNLGSGEDYSIAELAQQVVAVTGFAGRIELDASKPDGMPVKTLQSQPLKDMGWRPRWGMADALRETYQWFLDNAAELAGPRP